MRKGAFICVLLLLTFSSWTQVETPGVASSQSGTDVTRAGTGTSFTNRAGTVYTADQLATQLQSLRNNIEQILPVLTAYTESVSNVPGTGGRSVSGTVTELLSGVLNRRNNASNNASGNFFNGTNIVGVLQGLLNTNTTSTSSSMNAATLKDLADLQTELQSANSKLQRLNVPGTNSVTPLTPTGR